jgi:hypothetical protein
MDGRILLQANVIAFDKIFLLSGAILVASLPLLFLFKQGKPTTGGSAGRVHSE